jgi:hypothetical protein
MGNDPAAKVHLSLVLPAETLWCFINKKTDSIKDGFNLYLLNSNKCQNTLNKSLQRGWMHHR